MLVTAQSSNQIVLDWRRLTKTSRLSLCSFFPPCPLRRPEPNRHQLRDPRFLHSDAVKHRSNTHSPFAVGDQDELGLYAHLAPQVGEARDVGFVEWGVHFVEDAEWTRRVLEDADQQGKSCERFFAAG